MMNIEEAAEHHARALMLFAPAQGISRRELQNLLEMAFARGALYGTDRAIETMQHGMLLSQPAGSA